MHVQIDGVTFVPHIPPSQFAGWTIGTALTALRRDSKLSLEKASEGICGKGYLWEIEHDMSNPGFQIVAALAKRYGISIDALAQTVVKEPQ